MPRNDHVLPTGGRDVRASRSDRDRVADRLAVAFTEGRFDREEFDRRVDAALAARTRGELTELLADLPAPEPPPAPAEGHAARVARAVLDACCCGRPARRTLAVPDRRSELTR